MKSELRQQIRARKSEFSNQQLAALSSEIIHSILHDEDVSNAQTIMAYFSLPDEVCTHSLIPLLHAQGKTVLLPVVEGQDIVLKEYESEQTLAIGKYNIYEPQGTTFTDYQKIEVALIPGMAFDANGNRLGRGKGYYDRFLPKLKNAKRIGVCFDFQMVEQVPTNEFDEKMEKVICSGF